MIRLTKELAGYKNVAAIGLHELLLQQKKRPLGGRLYDALSNSDLEHLQDMERKYQEGKKIMMMIDAQMIKGITSYGYDDIAIQSHWVVYEGGLEFFDSDKQATTDLNKAEKVSFKIYTWGYDPETGLNNKRQKAYSKHKLIVGQRRIEIKSFKSIFYGYIEAY